MFQNLSQIKEIIIVTRGALERKVSLKVLQNSQEKTCAGVSF